MGRVLIFVMIMLLAWGAGFAIYYRLYAFLKRQILKKRDTIDEMLLANLDGIRKPLYLLVLAFGFELGLEVLFCLLRDLSRNRSLYGDGRDRQ